MNITFYRHRVMHIRIDHPPKTKSLKNGLLSDETVSQLAIRPSTRSG
jgi:hypothetical protein